MKITLIQIDKSGSNIMEQDYSLVLIKDKKEVFGVNIPQKVKDSLMHFFNTGELNINSKSLKKNKLRFKLRFHTAIIIELIKNALPKNKETILAIEICNDFDGHFHEIKDMLYNHTSKVNFKLKPEDIVQTKFTKPSFIDTVGKNIRNNIYKDYIIISLDITKLKNIIRK